MDHETAPTVTTRSGAHDLLLTGRGAAGERLAKRIQIPPGTTFEAMYDKVVSVLSRPTPEWIRKLQGRVQRQRKAMAAVLEERDTLRQAVRDLGAIALRSVQAGEVWQRRALAAEGMAPMTGVASVMMGPRPAPPTATEIAQRRQGLTFRTTLDALTKERADRERERTIWCQADQAHDAKVALLEHRLRVALQGHDEMDYGHKCRRCGTFGLNPTTPPCAEILAARIEVMTRRDSDLQAAVTKAQGEVVEAAKVIAHLEARIDNQAAALQRNNVEAAALQQRNADALYPGDVIETANKFIFFMPMATAKDTLQAVREAGESHGARDRVRFRKALRLVPNGTVILEVERVHP